MTLRTGQRVYADGGFHTVETIITRNQSGSIDLGVPRTVWAGVKIGL